MKQPYTEHIQLQSVTAMRLVAHSIDDLITGLFLITIGIPNLDRAE